jgi:hypothetical protein
MKLIFLVIEILLKIRSVLGKNSDSISYKKLKAKFRSVFVFSSSFKIVSKSSLNFHVPVYFFKRDLRFHPNSQPPIQSLQYQHQNRNSYNFLQKCQDEKNPQHELKKEKAQKALTRKILTLIYIEIIKLPVVTFIIEISKEDSIIKKMNWENLTCKRSSKVKFPFELNGNENEISDKNEMFD